MNIERVAHRVPEVGIRRTESPRRPFDLTVSDSGVEERTQPTAKPNQPAITSTPEMQSVLSVEETRALQTAFFTPAEGAVAEEPAAPARRGGIYNIRGQNAQRSAGVTSGALLDITG